MSRSALARAVGRSRCALAGAVVSAAVALASPPVSAQDGPDTLVLSLEEAVRLAHEGNPTYRRAVNQLALNGPESRNVWGNEILPSVNLTLLDTRYTGNLTRSATDDFGNPVANPDAEWSYFSSTNQRLSLDWRIQGLNLLHSHREHEEASRGRWLAEAAASWTLRAEVRRRFYRALEQEDLVRVEEAVRASRETDLEVARRLFEIAEVSRVDVLNAELELRQQGIQIQRRRRQRDQAVLDLRTALGVEDLPPLRPEEEPLPVFDPAPLDEVALIGRARAANPGLLESRSGLEGAEIGLDRAENRWWPQLLLSYTLGRTARRNEGEALFDFDHRPSDLTSNFFVGLSFPVLNDYFGARLEEARARVTLDDARQTLREARLEAEREVRAQLIELRNAWETLGLARRSLEIAGEALELAREEYRIGAGDFQALQDAVDREAEARRQVVEGRYAFVEALIALEEVLGGPVAPREVAGPGPRDPDGPDAGAAGADGAAPPGSR